MMVFHAKEFARLKSQNLTSWDQYKLDNRAQLQGIYKNALCAILTKSSTTIDFTISTVVRSVFLAEEFLDYDVSAEAGSPVTCHDTPLSTLRSHLQELPFWLSNGEMQHNYWSENHMLMWTVSGYLMRQKYGWQMDANLDNRLNHYLNLKLRYGYYEFFSTVYYRFTLGALLNLVDFAEDDELKYKATLAVERMLKEMLLVFNDQETFYSAAGRNFADVYRNLRKQSIFHMITGRGQPYDKADYAGAFLSTSTMDLDNICLLYTSPSPRDQRGSRMPSSA